MFILILLVCAILIIIGLALLIRFSYKWYMTRNYNYFKRKGIPHIKPKYGYGNAKGCGDKYHTTELIRRMYSKLKKHAVSGIYIFTQASVMISNLDLAKTIFTTDFAIFTNRGLYSNEFFDPLSANLVTLEDQKWKSLREKIKIAFSKSKLVKMMPTVERNADVLVAALHDNPEILDIMGRYTTDVIGDTAFGVSCNALNNKNSLCYQIGKMPFDNSSLYKRMFLNTFRTLSRILGLRTTPRIVEDFYMNVVAQIIAYRETLNERPNDLMKTMLLMKGGPRWSWRSSSQLTFKQVAALAVGFFQSGFEASSLTLTYLMYELAMNREIQEATRKSIREVLNKYDGVLSYEALWDMQYLDQCIHETLRKYPTACCLQRIAKTKYPIAKSYFKECQEETECLSPNARAEELSKTKITLEKGTIVVIPVYGIHVDPEIYPEPQKFNPDRFHPDEVAKRHPFAYLPFGNGPRVCIGQRYAMIEVKIAIVKILQTYKFTLDRKRTGEPLKIDPKKFATMVPGEEVFLSFQKI